MKHAQTIAMARRLLAEGRARDVARMLEPLLEPVPDQVPSAFDASQIVLRCLLARVRLLSCGDPAGALALLKPFDVSAVREGVTESVRAEVALWLGWTHTWQHTTTYDHARALHLLDEAAELFQQEMHAAGRCWAMLGQARAYFTIDEYPLMRQAVREATALIDHVLDAQAACWMLDLHTLEAWMAGRYARGLTYAETLAAHARQHHDTFAEGRAYTYQSLIFEDLGRPPTLLVDTATAAQTHLQRSAVRPGSWLRDAYRVHIRAQIRAGAWTTADALIDAALDATQDQPTATAHFLLERACLSLLHGQVDAAGSYLNKVEAWMQHHQHRLLAVQAALTRSTWYAGQDQQPALQWAERAKQLARETGHRRLCLETLLHQAALHVDNGDAEAARAVMAETQAYHDFFSALPLAAPRYAVLGSLALLEDTEDARTYFDQARLAYTLIGDVYQAAHMQVRLALLDGTRNPETARTLLQTARHTFEALETYADRDQAQQILDALPEPESAVVAQEKHAVDIGAALAQASLSVDLIAETWLKAAGHLLPNRWMGLYRCDEGYPWRCVREHGEAPATPPQTHEPCSARLYADEVLWLRLRGHPGPAFFFGVALSDTNDPEWLAAQARMKPWMPVAALALDHALLQAQHLDGDGNIRPQDHPLLHDFVAAAPAMRELVDQVYRTRASHSPVLITGEPGTGKQWLARVIHAMSERKDAPFVTVTCAGVAEAVVEETLFGRSQTQQSALQAAGRGTLFLDDIDKLPLDLQHRLLHYLQEGDTAPVDAFAPLPVRARIIAATPQDLKTLIREGLFLEDLYYRLHVIAFAVPPLRSRRAEIPLFVRHFLDTLRAAETPLPSFTNAALDILVHYDWPGNVRQLRNEVERALVFVRNEPAPLIDVPDLSPALIESVGARSSVQAVQEASLPVDRDLDQVLADTEKRLIERVLAEHEGQVTASANALGLSRQGLYKKLKRLHIDASRFHPDAESASPSTS